MSTSTGAQSAASADDWRKMPVQTVARAAELLCCSSAQVYALSHRNELELKRVAGRTVVATKGLVRLIDGAQPWTPSARGAAARNAALDQRVARRRQLPGHNAQGGSDAA